MKALLLILFNLSSYAQTKLLIEKLDKTINIKSDISHPEYCEEMQGHFRGSKASRINVCITGNGQFNRETFDYLHGKDWFSPKNKKDITTAQMSYSLPRIEVACFKDKTIKSIIQNENEYSFKFILSCDLKNKKEVDHEMSKILRFLKKNFENKKKLANELSKDEMKKWLSFLGLENPGLKLTSLYEESPIFVNCPDEVSKLFTNSGAKFEPSVASSYLPKNKIIYDEKLWKDPQSQLYKEQFEMAKKIQRDFEYKGDSQIKESTSSLIPSMTKEFDHPEVKRAEYWFFCMQKSPCVKESDFVKAMKIYMKDGSSYQFYSDQNIKYSLPINENTSGHEIDFLPDGEPRKSMFSVYPKTKDASSESQTQNFNFKPDLDENEY